MINYKIINKNLIKVIETKDPEIIEKTFTLDFLNEQKHFLSRLIVEFTESKEKELAEIDFLILKFKDL
jgi:hypothetical protein